MENPKLAAPARFAFRQLRSRALIAVALLALLPSPPANSSQTGSSGGAAATRIRFARGAITANVRGRFTKSQPRVCFLLGARAGQHMTVNIAPVTPQLAMAGQVTSPSGKQDGGPGGIIFDDDLTETGDYRICVNQHTMASNLPTGAFILEVMAR